MSDDFGKFDLFDGLDDDEPDDYAADNEDGSKKKDKKSKSKDKKPGLFDRMVTKFSGDDNGVIDDESDPDSDVFAVSDEVAEKGSVSIFVGWLFRALIVVAAIAVTIAAIGYGGWYIYQKAMEPEPEPEKEKAAIQLINTEQVAATERLCSIAETFGDKTYGLKFPSDEVRPNTMRKKMVKNLNFHADRTNRIANLILRVPSEAYVMAKEKTDNATVDTNYRSLGAMPDTTVTNRLGALGYEMRDFSQSLRDMSEDLDDIASYDGTGLRNQIGVIQDMLPKVTDKLSSDLVAALNDGFYDNDMTMVEALEDADCETSIIDEDKLKEQKQGDIDHQRVINDYVSFLRCETFLNTIKGKEEEFDDDVSACKEMMPRSQHNEKSWVKELDIDTQDDKRMIVYERNDAEEESADSEGESRGGKDSRSDGNES